MARSLTPVKVSTDASRQAALSRLRQGLPDPLAGVFQVFRHGRIGAFGIIVRAIRKPMTISVTPARASIQRHSRTGFS
jgi:hypothetical protein